MTQTLKQCTSSANSQSSSTSNLACLPSFAFSAVAVLYDWLFCKRAPHWQGHSEFPVMQYCMTHLLQAARASTKKGISPATARRNANQFGGLQEAGIFLASAICIAAELGIPVYSVLMDSAVPVIPGFILIVVTSVVFLKLVSYVHCNWDLRYFTWCSLP